MKTHFLLLAARTFNGKFWALSNVHGREIRASTYWFFTSLSMLPAFTPTDIYKCKVITKFFECSRKRERRVSPQQFRFVDRRKCKGPSLARGSFWKDCCKLFSLLKALYFQVVHFECSNSPRPLLIEETSRGKIRKCMEGSRWRGKSQRTRGVFNKNSRTPHGI